MVGQPVLAVAVVAVFAVFASGWPGFGGKVGGTIAMVPCFLLLAAAVAGIRLNWRRIGLVAVSGLVLFAVFALISYFTPVAGKSDIGTFAGDVLHGHAGGLLLRKISSNIGSLSVSAFSPVLPVVVVLTGLMLWRPAWFAVKTVPRAFAAEPLLRPVLWAAVADAGAGLAGRRLRGHRAGLGAAPGAAAGHRGPGRGLVLRSAGTLSWYDRRRTSRRWFYGSPG